MPNNMDISKEALGYCWVGIQRRPFYSARPIRRGKNKGKIMVEYRVSILKTKFEPMKESSLCWFPEHKEPTPNEP